MNTEKQTQLYVTDRDLEIFKFIWKWKAVSTFAIARKFYPGVRPFTAYFRLLKLEKNRYLKFVSFRHRMGGAWTLDNRGFNFLSRTLIDLKQKGFKTENIVHDYYSSAFHLGEWLTRAPNTSDVCTEQELRRIPGDLLPEWVPKSTQHRPDGYSVIQRGGITQIFAFETELTLKSKSRYEKTISFYDDEQTISTVFWLVGASSIQKTIAKSLAESYSTRPEIHNFIPFPEFKKLGWMVPISIGNFRGTRLIDLMVDGSFTEAIRQLDCSDSNEMLKNQKRPMLPSDYKKSKILKTSD